MVLVSLLYSSKFSYLVFNHTIITVNFVLSDIGFDLTKIIGIV